MNSAVAFAVSNPETTRLLLQYLWVIIPVLATLATFIIRLLTCCFFGARDGGGGGGALCNCCAPRQADLESHGRCHHPQCSSDAKKTDGEYAADDEYSPARMAHKRTQTLICCFGVVCLIMTMLVFAALYPFLVDLTKET